MKKIKLFLVAAGLLCTATGFAQKQCNLGITVTASAGYSTTLNYKDTCFFDVKIQNNGTAALATTDTIVVGLLGTTTLIPLVPAGAIASGQSFTATKSFRVIHTIDTLKAADLTGTVCAVLRKQADITVGTPPRPLTVTYTDNVATNDTSCNTITLKKRPNNGIFEWGSGSNEALALYPNPASGEVKFDIKADKAENVVLSVKDITGREVARKDYGKLPVGVNTTLRLDVSHLNAGLYLVEWNSGDRRATGKLTISR
ncbi:T9SS type A sorting domain-containing protein [Taibaiella koreensis]|uniref:T9SS type A sorting domain-containing protein n=1 Tax=Taibaiella koreensis TaxID=1268548 RepID=UPI000E5A008C|nr:T9SS type A sorting domain-containing protein [Taibaiella koreensis]